MIVDYQSTWRGATAALTGKNYDTDLWSSADLEIPVAITDVPTLTRIHAVLSTQFVTIVIRVEEAGGGSTDRRVIGVRIDLPTNSRWLM